MISYYHYRSKIRKEGMVHEMIHETYVIKYMNSIVWKLNL